MAPLTSPHIALIGLGAMGFPMAGRLAAAGVDVTVYDVNPAARERAADALDPGADHTEIARWLQGGGEQE